MRKHVTASVGLLMLWPTSLLAAEAVPCDPMTVGSMWKYSEQSAMASSEVTRLVTSNEAGVITVSETSIHVMSDLQLKQENIQTLHEQDGIIVLKQVSMQNGFPNIELNMPICGPINSDVALLGSETVEVPAGRFDAQVYEIVTEGAPLGGGGMAATRHWYTIYYVPGIGTVKSLMVNEIPTPTWSQRTSQNPEAAVLLQEGIAAMQKGEDPAKFFEEMAKLQQPAAGDDNVVAIEMQKNTITRELIDFAIE